MTDPLGLSGPAARLFDEFLIWWLVASHPGSDLPAIPATADAVREFLAEHPVTPGTVLAYLDEHPGGEGTQRNRVAALNAAHRIIGAPIPGAAEAVRRALNPKRAARLAEAKALAIPVIGGLPTHGADGLLGRRDAVIVLLATSGLSWHQISALTLGDVAITDTTVTIGAQPLLELTATGLEGSCPVAVFRRWLALVAHSPTATGHIVVAKAMAEPGHDPAMSPVLMQRYANQPLLPVFDERGMATGLLHELEPLPLEAIAGITRALLCAAPTSPGHQLDSDYYDRGLAARRRERPILGELDDLLDQFDDILARFTT
ncbi:hypothetical protein [Nocardia salmonicida]|uniref:hypothetical protein n=1 Tax=Nocardia salmonicida TaxID=53431 RepID=UPI0007A38C1F|nr:hypothetical protein [Nocardia salmonicida]